MNASPATVARSIRRNREAAQAVTQDVRRLAYTSTTGDAPKAAPSIYAPLSVEDDPHCFVCGRHTGHFAEHDDLVDAGKARYTENGSVVWI